MKHAYQDMTGQRTARGYTPRWWVSDLPGHNGAVKIQVGDGRKSDWGWTDDKAKAIPLTPYWQRRFMAYGRECWKSYGLVPVEDAKPVEPFANAEAIAANAAALIRMFSDR